MYFSIHNVSMCFGSQNLDVNDQNLEKKLNFSTTNYQTAITSYGPLRDSLEEKDDRGCLFPFWLGFDTEKCSLIG